MNNQKPKSRMQYGLKRTAPTCRGNTLVPVIIALAISMVASVTFLQQGKVLNEKTRMLEAPDELVLVTKKYKEAIKTFKEEKETYKKAPGTSKKPTLTLNHYDNVFGNQVFYSENTRDGNYILSYNTKHPSQCQELAALLVKHPDVSRICCDCSPVGIGPSPTTITIFQY